MAIKYYPLSRVKTNLYTEGGWYLNGEVYRGPYYLTYDGKAYTGSNPATGPNELLTNVPRELATVEARRLRGEAPITELHLEPKSNNLSLVVPYNPLISEEEYRKGYFKRYFVKRIVDKGYIVEVDYANWTEVVNKLNRAYEVYEGVDLMWQLTGPRNDKRISQYQIKAGVFDTNKRITEKKAKTFIGLIEFIGGDYTKFARITE